MRFILLLVWMPSVIWAQVTDSLLKALEQRDQSRETVDWMIQSAAALRRTAPEQMTEWALMAQEMAQKIGYTEGEGDALLHMGISYWQRNMHQEAMESYLQSLTIYEKLKLPAKSARVKMNIGNTYDELGQVDKAKSYIRSALSELEKTGDSLSISKGIMNLGVIYFYQKSYDSALWCFENVLAYRSAHQDTAGMAMAHLNLANVYEYKTDIRSAVKHYGIARTLSDPAEMLFINVTLGLGNALLLDGQETDGLALIEEALGLARERKQPKMEQFAYGVLRTHFEGKGDFKKAYEYAQMEHTLDSDLRGDEVQKQIEVMNLKYEDEKKARALLLLQAEKEKQTLQLIGLVVLVCLLAVIGGLAVMLMRLRMRAIRTKKEELRQELDAKNKELTSYTLNFIQKNELLSELSEKIGEMKKDASQKLMPKLNQMNALINSHSRIDQDWEKFRVMFEEVHAGFFFRLKESYPDLGNAELKLCALLRLNLNLKESSQILGISSDSVKTARSRLRKKLGLSTQDNLVDFLIRFDGETVTKAV